jgi:hypothetical protein
MDAVGPYLSEVAMRTAVQLLVLLGPALILGLAMHVLAGFVESRALAVLGRTAYLALFGWLGTAVHETGHAMFCPLFGHRITAFRPFSPDPHSDVLGYVEHEWNRRSLWARLGNFFIGIGPVILGTLVLYVASLILLGSDVLGRVPQVQLGEGQAASLSTVGALGSSVLGMVMSTLGGVFRAENLGHWQFWVFLYLAFAVGTGIRLSPSDLKGAASGFLVLVLGLLLVNLATAWAAGVIDPLLRVLAPILGIFLGVMTFALTLSIVFALPIWGLSKLVSRGAG